MDVNTANSIRYGLAALCIVAAIFWGQLTGSAAMAFVAGILIPTSDAIAQVSA